jgi:hypothetical protein
MKNNYFKKLCRTFCRFEMTCHISYLRTALKTKTKQATIQLVTFGTVTFSLLTFRSFCQVCKLFTELDKQRIYYIKRQIKTNFTTGKERSTIQT